MGGKNKKNKSKGGNNQNKGSPKPKKEDIPVSKDTHSESKTKDSQVKTNLNSNKQSLNSSAQGENNNRKVLESEKKETKLNNKHTSSQTKEGSSHEQKTESKDEKNCKDSHAQDLPGKKKTARDENDNKKDKLNFMVLDQKSDEIKVGNDVANIEYNKEDKKTQEPLDQIAGDTETGVKVGVVGSEKKERKVKLDKEIKNDKPEKDIAQISITENLQEEVGMKTNGATNGTAKSESNKQDITNGIMKPQFYSKEYQPKLKRQLAAQVVIRVIALVYIVVDKFKFFLPLFWPLLFLLNFIPLNWLKSLTIWNHFINYYPVRNIIELEEESKVLFLYPKDKINIPFLINFFTDANGVLSILNKKITFSDYESASESQYTLKLLNKDNQRDTFKYALENGLDIAPIVQLKPQEVQLNSLQKIMQKFCKVQLFEEKLYMLDVLALIPKRSHITYIIGGPVKVSKLQHVTENDISNLIQKYDKQCMDLLLKYKN